MFTVMCWQNVKLLLVEYICRVYNSKIVAVQIFSVAVGLVALTNEPLELGT
jgi:hypothetical protein